MQEFNQDEISYSDIVDLKFKVTECNDNVFFNQYGFQYNIFQKKLTKRIFIEWDQVDRTCEMIREDKERSIKSRLPIKNLDQIKMYIDFFTND